MTAPPRRLLAAVDRLDPAPGWRVLEVGCGSGVALELLAARLPDGHVTGVDRSATAVARARQRLAARGAADRADVVQADLATCEPGGPFDAVLAVNVNVFWTSTAEAEVRRLGALVRPGGVVLLGYEVPPGSDPGRVRAGASAAFGRHGWQVATASGDGLEWVTARR